MNLRRWLVPISLFLLLLMPLPAQARPTDSVQYSPVQCKLPESNADGLAILNNYYPGYWWDHTDITVAVQAHPSTTSEQMAAIREALAIWSSVLAYCFEGQITLTDVTDSGINPQKAADIVLHFVPHAGGVVFGGVALCGEHGCPNILVRSDLPPSLNRAPYTPERIKNVTLHEIGHALGLGHATNLNESSDLMGYNWSDENPPVLSDCDIDALTFVFAWFFEGKEPHPPALGPYDCSLD